MTKEEWDREFPRAVVAVIKAGKLLPRERKPFDRAIWLCREQICGDEVLQVICR